MATVRRIVPARKPARLLPRFLPKRFSAPRPVLVLSPNTTQSRVGKNRRADFAEGMNGGQQFARDGNHPAGRLFRANILGLAEREHQQRMIFLWINVGHVSFAGRPGAGIFPAPGSLFNPPLLWPFCPCLFPCRAGAARSDRQAARCACCGIPLPRPCRFRASYP